MEKKFYTIKKNVFILVAMVSLFYGFDALAGPPNVTWTNGSGNNKWSTASNWNTGSVPTSGYTVNIPSMSGATIYVDGTCTVGIISMNGNTTLSINAGKSLTVSVSLILNTASSVKAVLNVNSGSLVCSAVSGTGIINAGSGSLTLKSSVSNTVTINPGTSTIIMSGASAQGAIYLANYNNLQIDNTNGLALKNDITISGDLTGTGKLDAGSHTVALSGNMNLTTFTYGTSTVKLAGSSSQSINAYTFYNLENDNNAGTTLGGNVTVNNQLTFDPSGGPGAYSNPSYLNLNGYTLTIGSSGSVSSASETNGYVVTGGSGYLNMYAGSGGNTFPFGPTDSNYTPITITAGTSSNFNATVTNSITNYTLENVINHAVKATWLVTPVADVASFSAALQWKTSEQELSSLDRNHMYVYYRNTQSTATTWNKLGSLTAASGSDPYTVNSGTMSLTNGTPYYLVTADENMSLPVELLSFTAKTDNVKNILNWQTASEINNDHFEVLRSENGNDWTQIGTVEGHGTTNEKQGYNFIDANVIALNVPVVYYKLKQVDFNGAFVYSEIQKVELAKSQNEVQYYPNPVKDILTISFSNSRENNLIKICDMQGKSIYSETTSGNGNLQKQLDLSGLNSGMYILQINSSTESSSHFIFKN